MQWPYVDLEVMIWLKCNNYYDIVYVYVRVHVCVCVENIKFWLMKYSNKLLSKFDLKLHWSIALYYIYNCYSYIFWESGIWNLLLKNFAVKSSKYRHACSTMNLLIQDIARRYNYYHNTLAKPRIIAHQFEPNII